MHPILQEISHELRGRIARVRNVIVALANQNLSIFDTSVIYTYEDSEPYEVKDLLKPDVVAEITARAKILCLPGAEE